MHYASFVVACLLAGSVAAQPYPSRPVRLIVAQTAGGSADLVARAVTQKLGDVLGQQFVVDNRGGASGIIAGEIHLNFSSMPSAIGHVKTLNHEAAKAMRSPELKGRLAPEGAEPVANSPEEFRVWLKHEITKWAAVVKAANIRID